MKVILYFFLCAERSDLPRTISEPQTNNQWQPISQQLFTTNVIEMAKDNQPHRAQSLSDKGQVMQCFMFPDVL